jgi:DNA-binding CsgD family transcriptional regulator
MKRVHIKYDLAIVDWIDFWILKIINQRNLKKGKLSVIDQGKRQGISMREEKLLHQQQAVLNLYNSGITPEVIALQLDITEREVINIIRKVLLDNKRKEQSIRQVSDSSSLGMFYLDAVVDIEAAIKDAQNRMWKALKLEPKFNIPLEQTQEILKKFSDSKITSKIFKFECP